MLLSHRGNNHLVTGTNVTIRQNDQSAGWLEARCNDGAVHFGLIANRRNDQLECSRRAGGFHCRQKHSSEWGRVRIEDDRGRSDAGRNFVEQLHPLCSHAGLFGFEAVMLPPGRARLWTKPWATGSAMATNTMGIVLVAALAAISDGVELATRISGRSSTSSLADACARPAFPAGQRYSISRLRPSDHPNSSRPRRRAAACSYPSGSSAARPIRTPMRRTLGCRAFTPSGHAAAPPSTPRNLRRSICPSPSHRNDATIAFLNPRHCTIMLTSCRPVGFRLCALFHS